MNQVGLGFFPRINRKSNWQGETPLNPKFSGVEKARASSIVGLRQQGSWMS